MFLGRTISVIDRRQVYLLAVLIAFFSGAWPYIKLALMLVAWMLPPRWCSVAWRDWLLIWLDILGKWCPVALVLYL